MKAECAFTLDEEFFIMYFRLSRKITKTAITAKDPMDTNDIP